MYRRWSEAYRKQLIREDIRDATEIRQIDLVETLFSLLPSRVGSPLSALSLSRDLQVSPNTVQSWLRTFESFYLAFQISPWTQKISRAITKEKKLYLFDYGDIISPAARFENMVALELLRAVSNWNDWGWGRFDLHYLRNKEGEEADFLISKERAPFLIVEAKLSEDQVAKSLMKFQLMLEIPAVQLLHAPCNSRIIKNQKFDIRIASAAEWLAILP